MLKIYLFLIALLLVISTYAQDVITSNKLICKNNATVKVDVNNAISFNWRSDNPKINFINPEAQETAVINLQEGINNLYCDYQTDGETKTFHLQINYFIPVAYAGKKQNKCKNETYLSAELPDKATGHWTYTKGYGDFANPASPKTKVSNMAKGENIYVWKITHNGCTAEDKVIINNNSFTVNAGQDKFACNGKTTLNGSDPETGTGTWTMPYSEGYFADKNDRNTEVHFSGSGVNILVWTVVNNNCSASDEVAITNQIIPIDAGKKRHICGNTTYMLGSDPITAGANAKGKWTVKEGYGYFQDNQYKATKVTKLKAGKNIFVWTISINGCDAHDEVEIYNDNPQDVSTDNNKYSCNGETVLSANIGNGTSLRWEQDGGEGEIEKPTENNTKVTGLGKNLNTFTLTVSKGECNITEKITVRNKTTFATAPGDKTICGENIELIGGTETGNTGKWTVEKGSADIKNENNPEITLKNIKEGENIFRWTATNGICTAYDEVTITNNMPTKASIISGGGNTCLSENNLSAMVPTIGTGLWTWIGGEEANIANPNEANTKVTMGKGTYKFKWTVINKSCKSEAIIEFVNHAFKIEAGHNRDICESETVLNATVPETEGTAYWERIKGTAEIKNINQAMTKVSNLSFGENVFRWHIDNGYCEKEDDVTIICRYPTQAKISTQNKDICTNSIEIRANSPTSGTGLWSSIRGKGHFENPTMAVTNVKMDKGLNIFRWTISAGKCFSSADVAITNKSIEADGGMNVEICKNTYTMQANLPDEQTTGKWLYTNIGTAKFSDMKDPKANLTDIKSGRNVFRWIVTKGKCTDYKDISITNNLFSTKVMGQENIIKTCKDKVIVTAEDYADNFPDYGFGQWDIIDGSGHIVKKNDRITEIEGLQSGSLTARWTINVKGCIVYDEVKIECNKIDALVSQDQLLCEENTTQIRGEKPAGADGSWKTIKGGAVYDKSLSNPQLTNIRQGENIFLWTVSNGKCTNKDSVTLKNYIFSVNLPKKEEHICSYDHTIEANELAEGAIGKWFSQSGGFSIISPSNNITEVKGLSGGVNTLRWTVSQNGCTAFDDMIVYNEIFSVYAGNKQTVCENQARLRASISAEGQALNATGKWEIPEGTELIYPPGWTDFSIPVEKVPNAIITKLKKGVNKIKWTAKTQTCEFHDYIEIENNTINYYPGDNQIICENSTSLSAQAAANGSKGYWIINNEKVIIDDTSSPTTKVSNLRPGINLFYWVVSENNCKSKKSVSIDYKVLDLNAQAVKTNENKATITGTPLKYKGKWEVLNTDAEVYLQKKSSAEIIGLDYGYNKMKWSVTDGKCSASTTTSILRTFSVNAGEDKEICKTETWTNAHNSEVAPGRWEIVSGSAKLENPSSYSTDVTNIGNENVVLNWIVEKNGYKAIDQMKINHKVELKIPASPFVCKPAAYISVSKPNDAVGSWELREGEGIIHKPQNYYTAVTNLKEGINIFRYNAKIGECTNYIDVKVKYYITKKAVIEPVNTQICNNQIILKGNMGEETYGKWSVVEGNAKIANTSANKTLFTDLKKGANVLRWSMGKGICTSTDEITINFTPLKINITEQKNNICHGDSTGSLILHTNGEEPINYFINQEETAQTSPIENMPAGEYIITAVDKNKCISLPFKAKIEQPDKITYEKMEITDSKYGLNSGSVKLLLKGGTRPFACYLGNEYNKTAEFFHLPSGVHSIRVIDANKCKITFEVDLEKGTVGIDEQSYKGTKIKIYPNPAYNEIFVEVNEKARVKFLDISGKEVIEYTNCFPNSTKRIETAELKSGIYIIRIETKHNIINKKIIIR